jgi:hypothetical protein
MTFAPDLAQNRRKTRRRQAELRPQMLQRADEKDLV